MKRHFEQRPSPALVVALLALFVALGGTGLAATGDNFILGQTNTASSTSTLNAPVAGGKALQVNNNDTTNATSTALGLHVAAGHPALAVNTVTRVANLNADLLDGVDSSKLLRNTIPLSLTGASGGGVINGTNTSTGNGLVGVTGSPTASGVYGQNDGGGYGVAGRSDNGVGVYGESFGSPNAHGVTALSDGPGGTIVGTNDGSGPALELHTFGGPQAPITVDSPVKVGNLNADRVDGLDSTQLVVGTGGVTPSHGSRVLANRLAPGAPGQILLDIPNMGRLRIESCDGSDLASLSFDTNGTGNVDLMFSGVDFTSGSGTHPFVGSLITSTWSSLETAFGTYTFNIARDTFNTTKIATMWVSWNANGCRFEAQALQSPQL